jgi:hypothetical protein
LKTHGTHIADGERVNRLPPRPGAHGPHEDPSVAARRRGRLLLIIVGVFFLGPVVVAWVMHNLGWQPGGHVNKGALLSPPIALAAFDAPRLDAGERALRENVWSVVIVSRGECSAACAQSVADTRRVLDLLGADRDRVQRILVSTVPPAPGDAGTGQDLIAFDASTPAQAALAAPFAAAADGAYYVADPRRNLILSYAPGQNAKDLLDDLKRLLKYSGE